MHFTHATSRSINRMYYYYYIECTINSSTGVVIPFTKQATNIHACVLPDVNAQNTSPSLPIYVTAADGSTVEVSFEPPSRHGERAQENYGIIGGESYKCTHLSLTFISELTRCEFLGCQIGQNLGPVRRCVSNLLGVFAQTCFDRSE